MARFIRKNAAALVALILLLALMALLPGITAAAETVAPVNEDILAEVSETGTVLEVYCFEAGKADAFLLTTENGTVLIDCGVKGFGQTILDELASRGIERIDCLIVTHFDQDHVGGAAKVLNNIEVDTVLQSNCPKDSTEYAKYIKALNTAGLEPETVSEPYAFVLDGVLFCIGPPARSNYKNDDSNNSSLIVTVYNGDNTLLFMGDAQTERLEEYLENAPVDCDLLKVPHHGGEDELTDELIAAVAPEYAIITSSDEEPESEVVMHMLSEAGAETYLTRTAPVIIYSDGAAVKVSYAE